MHHQHVHGFQRRYVTIPDRRIPYLKLRGVPRIQLARIERLLDRRFFECSIGVSQNIVFSFIAPVEFHRAVLDALSDRRPGRGRNAAGIQTQQQHFTLYRRSRCRVKSQIGHYLSNLLIKFHIVLNGELYHISGSALIVSCIQCAVFRLDSLPPSIRWRKATNVLFLHPQLKICDPVRINLRPDIVSCSAREHVIQSEIQLIGHCDVSDDILLAADLHQSRRKDAAVCRYLVGVIYPKSRQDIKAGKRLDPVSQLSKIIFSHLGIPPILFLSLHPRPPTSDDPRTALRADV
nr:MAG TPA: hypothetical protein [Caudoviricetes sp.]